MFTLSQPLLGAVEQVLVSLLSGQIPKLRLQSNKSHSSTRLVSEESKQNSVQQSVLLPTTQLMVNDIGRCLANVGYVDVLSSQTKRAPILTLTSRNVQIHLNSNGVVTVQRRGFRSKSYLGRSAEKQLGKNSAVSNALGLSFLKNAWKEYSNKDNLKILLENSNVQAKDKIKIAFAEGYEAGRIFSKRSGRFLSLLMLPGLIFIAFYIFTNLGIGMRLGGTSGNQVVPEEISVTFDDVKGVDEAKDEVLKIVDYLKDPDKYTKLGARLPKGVLLVGPPGCGKTLLAKAIAGEAKVPFFRTSGSEFEEMLVGLGAKRVRDLFTTARSRAPCVIFIDEIDSIGSKRSYSAMHPYANQTINQLLNEMDGFQPSSGVIVLAATNRRKNLDPALMRPGRFDVEILVQVPDLAGRMEIFELYLKKIKIDADVDTEKLSRRTIGYSAADIENMVNQAALKAAADNKASVDMHYLDMAQDLIAMGPAKKKLPLDKDTNINTAYHEAGHALVAYFTKDATPVHKVTITPRGQSLGHTSFSEIKEMYGQSRSQLFAKLDVAMGGRAGEELLSGAEHVTTGPASDLAQATKVAEAMVRMYGMSDKAGLRFFGPQRSALDPEVQQFSDQTTDVIDAEIKRILAEAYERAKNVLKQNAGAHKRLAEALLQYETLTADEMKLVIDGQPLNKKLR